MKKTLIIWLICLLGAMQTAKAEDDYTNLPDAAQSMAVDSGDPCTVFLCMAGMALGERPSECDGAIRKFFSINAFKKHHRFNPGKTFDMRRDFLGQCPSADPEHVSKILSKFGRLRG